MDEQSSIQTSRATSSQMRLFQRRKTRWQEHKILLSLCLPVMQTYFKICSPLSPYWRPTCSASLYNRDVLKHDDQWTNSKGLTGPLSKKVDTIIKIILGFRMYVFKITRFRDSDLPLYYHII